MSVSAFWEGRASMWGVAQRGLLVVASCVLTFVLIEGGSSAALFLHDAISVPVVDRTYTRYDSLLGWVGIPNAYFRDMYGPGVYLKINALGFRGNADVGPHGSMHKLRVIWSGDSFTFGYGVDNDHTWCQLLSLRWIRD